jgi:hypothetical protein
VSIQAHKLRRALAHYFGASVKNVKNDTIRIDIPKGTYVPVFEKRIDSRTNDTAINGEIPDISVKSSMPSVLVRPLCNISGDPEFDFWGIGLATELAGELNRYLCHRAAQCRHAYRMFTAAAGTF